MALTAPPLEKVATFEVGKTGFRVTVESDIRAMRKRLNRFTRTGVRRAEFRAVNKALGKANTAMKRDISKSFNLKQKTFAQHLSLRRATFQSLTA